MTTVRGPDGAILSESDLPPAGAVLRWTFIRKARVIYAIRGGMISMETARARWNLGADELVEWLRDFDTHGFRGLKVTKLPERRYV
jgi:hypothetical protein